MDELICNLSRQSNIKYKISGSSIFTYFKSGELVFERRYNHGELWSISDNNGKVYMNTI